MRFLQLFGAGEWRFGRNEGDKWELDHSDSCFAFSVCIKVSDYFNYLSSIHIFHVSIFEVHESP